MSSQYFFNTNESSRSFYQMPQHYQSTACFKPQVQASVRVLGSQDQYPLTSSPRIVQISPQQHHFQFDSRQQPGHAAGPAVVYQTPGAAQFTHRNVDLWTENQSSHPQDHFVQAQRVSVRSVSTGTPQQSHSISPQRHQDHLQQYYNQLTPEQHQQLQRSSYEQRISTQTVTRIDEPKHYPTQQQPRGEEEYHPVGIRNLMNKFDAPKPRHHIQPRSRSTSTRQYPAPPGPRAYTSHPITYSALPKPHEPPVNSLEYYQMLQQGGVSFNNIQQAVAPSHIQHAPIGGFGGLRDRFKTGSLSDDFNRATPPAHVTGGAGSNLQSIRNQYMKQTKEVHMTSSQPIQNIPRTIIGEDYPPKQQQQQQAPGQTTTAPVESNEHVEEEGISSF